MDHTSYSYTSSSSSSLDNHPPKPIKSSRPSYLDTLHSVKKTIQKPVITKHFIAPLPPAPAKVYNVESSKFKEVVRRLTSSPEFQSSSIRRLQSVAPPPLVLSNIPKPAIFSKPPLLPPSAKGVTGPGPGPSPSPGPLSSFTLSPGFCKFLNETLDTNRFVSKSPVVDCFGSLSPLGLNFSTAPRAYDPFGVALMSPFGFLSPSSSLWSSSALLNPAGHSLLNQNLII